MSSSSKNPAERKTPPEYLALDRPALLAKLQTSLEKTRHCLDVLQLDAHPIDPFRRAKGLEALLKGAETQQSRLQNPYQKHGKQIRPPMRMWRISPIASIANLPGLNGGVSSVANKVDGGVERIEQLLHAILRRPANGTPSASFAPQSSLNPESLEHQDGMEVAGQQQESISTPSSLTNCLYVHFIPSCPNPTAQRPSQSKILLDLNTRLRRFPDFDGTCVLQAYWGDDSHILLLADTTATCDMLLQHQAKWVPSLFTPPIIHVWLRRAGQTRSFLILEDVVRRWPTTSKHFQLYGPATSRDLDQVAAELLRQYPHCAQHLIGSPVWGRHQRLTGKQDNLILCRLVFEVDSEEFVEEFSTDNPNVTLFKHLTLVSKHILRDVMY